MILDPATVQTNIVIFQVTADAPDAATVVTRAREQGVLLFAFGPRTLRLVTHADVSTDQCVRAGDVLSRYLRKLRAATDHRQAFRLEGPVHEWKHWLDADTIEAEQARDTHQDEATRHDQDGQGDGEHRAQRRGVVGTTHLTLHGSPPK